jgi:protein-S-isoprenylcysteine O-methyltransferase Ste14
LGGTILACTLFSFVFFILYLLGFYIFVRFVEEKELLSRFGTNYASYQKSVPMFFVGPHKLMAMLKFIFSKEQK